MTNQTYRGFHLHFDVMPTPEHRYTWWSAADDDGHVIARTATLDELKAEIDAYLEDE